MTILMLDALIESRLSFAKLLIEVGLGVKCPWRLTCSSFGYYVHKFPVIIATEKKNVEHKSSGIKESNKEEFKTMNACHYH